MPATTEESVTMKISHSPIMKTTMIVPTSSLAPAISANSPTARNSILTARIALLAAGL